MFVQQTPQLGDLSPKAQELVTAHRTSCPLFSKSEILRFRADNLTVD